ncbi:MAG: ATP-binding cassette domain-containing protein, partial [Chloroflexota bacterium]|nr:ATP-binding cassette domain-containing protein [Chloroflexota bacterium]
MAEQVKEGIDTEGYFVVCNNLVKIYKVADLEVVALQGLDLRLESGEMMAIVGASGSGKTTLLNILGGLDRPSAGQVIVGEQDLLKLSDTALNSYRRENVGFVWQQVTRNLIPYLTAQENVELPMTMAGRPWKQKKEWAEELLDAIGLWERRDHKMAQLSGGEQQRVAIAVGLANHPSLLLGDEPTGEVDSETAGIIYETFHRLNESYDLTTIIVTHDPNIASHVDRVVAIRDGKTSSETVRQVTPPPSAWAQGGEDVGLEEEISFEEYVVLDAAGRLQIPRDYLDELGITDRVTVEMEQDGILIRP